ncbi:MAG: sensor histidine kinase [Clostridia bacterium]|nr:sensor histidine kinase [Clostridia bacterium]
MELFDEIVRAMTGFNSLILIAEIVHGIGFAKRRHFWIRSLVFVAFFLLGGFNRISLAMHIAPFWSYLYGVIPFINMYYIVIYLLSIGCMWFCFDEKPVRLIFVATSAFLIEHICSHACQLFTFWIQGDHVTIPTVSRLFELALFALILVIFYFTLIRRFYEKDREPTNRSMLLFVAISILLISIFSSYVYYAGLVSPATHIYAISVGILLIVIQFEVFTVSEEKTEKHIIEGMLKEQAKQQSLYDNNLQFINMRCHDLKNQIEVLKRVLTESERDKTVAEMESALELRDTEIRTGNEVLDVVLMEKHIRCMREGIPMTCLADGEAVAFMSSSDLCMLFGNALNNAIEAEEKQKEEDRFVSVLIKREKAFVRIYVENFWKGEVELKDGLPVSSSKDNKEEHGFGTKSIRHIVRKYGGNVTASVRDEIFTLSILFPIVDWKAS